MKLKSSEDSVRSYPVDISLSENGIVQAKEQTELTTEASEKVVVQRINCPGTRKVAIHRYIRTFDISSNVIERNTQTVVTSLKAIDVAESGLRVSKVVKKRREYTLKLD